MKKADYISFCNIYNDIKHEYGATATNIFKNSAELNGLLYAKECFIASNDKTLLLLIPYHNYYYDLLYVTHDTDSLDCCLCDMLKNYPFSLPVRASLIGKDTLQDQDIVSCFQNNGFYLGKKIYRATKGKNSIEKMLKAMRILGQDEYDNVSFANLQDAEEIFELLREDFQIMEDNLPELDEIRRNIDKKQVAVLKKDNQILALSYFTINRHILHGIYNVTRKDYRKGYNFFPAIEIFVHDYLKKHNIQITRYFGWRDINNIKLGKFASKWNQVPDGIYINQMIWSPAEKEATQPQC